MPQDELNLKPIAYLRSDFPSCFGLPRQSGMVSALTGTIEFCPQYIREDFIRGLSAFSHIWLIWGFSESGETKRATIRPPRLGGKSRVGVFATRSPHRPNPIGLSCVRIERIEIIAGKAKIIVSGIDMMDKTPIYDIKPYIPFSDSLPDASGSFAEREKHHFLKVEFPDELLSLIPASKREGLICALSCDPKPSYQHDETRIYHMAYAGFDIGFHTTEDKIYVNEVKKGSDNIID